jgi:hypothetical protein
LEIWRARAVSPSLRREMEVKTKTRVATSLRKGDIGMKDFSAFGVAKSALTMYVERPHDELTLEDFEVAALDRLTGKCIPPFLYVSMIGLG